MAQWPVYKSEIKGISLPIQGGTQRPKGLRIPTRGIPGLSPYSRHDGQSAGL